MAWKCAYIVLAALSGIILHFAGINLTAGKKKISPMKERQRRLKGVAPTTSVVQLKEGRAGKTARKVLI